MICSDCRQGASPGDERMESVEPVATWGMVSVETVPTLPSAADADRILKDSVKSLDSQLITFKQQMQDKMANVLEEIASLKARQAKLEIREERLEAEEKTLEQREAKVENQVAEVDKSLTALQQREAKLEMQMENATFGGTTGTPATYTAIAEDYALRPSVVKRREEGVTVDFLEVEAEEIYVFSESTWDIAIFIGTPSLGWGGSILTLILLLMNVVMQLVFVGIVAYNFSEAKVNEEMIDAANQWRLGMAHDISLLQGDNFPSLVARVCGGDMSLQTATAQQTLYQDVADYLKPDATGFESIFVGRALCIVALVCWYLMVSREVHTALDLCRAVLSMPTATVSKLEPVEVPLQVTRYKVASMPIVRKSYSIIIVTYRVAVAVILGFCGTVFLAYTIEIEELVLNAVALEIILNIDDLLFDAVTTANARHMVQRLEPARMPRWPHRKGIDMKAALMALIIPLSVFLADITLIEPMQHDLLVIAEALCGGNRDFVYSKNVLNMYEMAPTIPYGEDAHDSQAENEAALENETNATNLANISKPIKLPPISRQAIKEATKALTSEDRADASYAIWADGPLALRAKRLFKEAVTYVTNGECRDQLEGPLLSYVQHALSDPSIRTCADVADWCSKPSFQDWTPDGGKALMVRMACPQTCDCDQPLSTIFINSGCPAFCTTLAHATFNQVLNASRCEQKTASATANDEIWMKWAAQVREYGEYRKNPKYISMAAMMLKDGCKAMTNGAAVKQCKWNEMDAPFKTAGMICPRHCNCQRFGAAGYRIPDCPLECDLCAFHRRRRSYGKVSTIGMPKGKQRDCQYWAATPYPRCKEDTHLSCNRAKSRGWSCEREGKWCDKIGMEDQGIWT